MVAKKTYIPEKGDLVWINFTPTRGHKQEGYRPACVISPRNYNQKSGLMLACPVTSKEKGYPFEVRLSGKITGVVLSDQVRSVDWKSRRATFIEKLSFETFSEIKEKLLALLEG